MSPVRNKLLEPGFTHAEDFTSHLPQHPPSEGPITSDNLLA